MNKNVFLIILIAFLGSINLHAQTVEPTQPPVQKIIEPPVQKSTEPPVQNADFSTGLYFDINNTGPIPPMEFEYDLSLDNGKSLTVGNTILSEKTFYFAVGPLGKMMSQFPKFAGEDADRNALIFRWPENLLKNGVIEVISRSGNSLWKREITEKEVLKWKNRVLGWRKKLGLNPKLKPLPALLTTQLAILDWSKEVPHIAESQDWFRFCLTQTEAPHFTRLCSSRYMAKKTSTGFSLAKQVITDGNTRALLRNEEAALKVTTEVSADLPLQFYADLATGMSYEFLAMPPKINIADIAETKIPNLIRVTGWDVFPHNPYSRIKLEKYGKIVEMIGFQPTIKDDRKFWQAGLKVDTPYFYFPGVGGGVFKQKFKTEGLPKESMRIFLQKNTPKGTYAKSITLQGRKLETASTGSTEWSTYQDPKNPMAFDWSFRAAEPGQINRSYLQEVIGNKTYRSYFEIYRSYSHEVSARTTGVYASNTLVLIGEVAYNYWIDNFFGWENYYLARQRWGLNAKYFKSLNALPVDSAGTKGNLDSMVFDVKYRLSPGLWTRDETVGLIGSYQNITFGPLKAPMAGFGAFWARSMPLVFDRIFNYFPFMNYPKWVDVEFIYYTAPLAADVTLTSSFSLNFHGQVLWQKNFFGEAGFGLKRYAFSNPSINRKAELNSLYGTVGMGLKF